MIERRLAEIGPEDLLFTAPMGGWLRRSNWGRYVSDRADDDVGWPRSEDGTWRRTFHSLRHVFATWALHDARIPIEDVSRLLGHSSTRVTGHLRPRQVGPLRPVLQGDGLTPLPDRAIVEVFTSPQALAAPNGASTPAITPAEAADPIHERPCSSVSPGPAVRSGQY